MIITTGVIAVQVYFKAVAAELGLFYAFGAEEEILTPQRSKTQTYPMLAVEFPSIEYVGSDETDLQKWYLVRLSVVGSVQKNDLDKRLAVLAETEVKTDALIQRILADFQIGVGFNAEPVMAFTHDNLFGWTFTAKLPTSLC